MKSRQSLRPAPVYSACNSALPHSRCGELWETASSARAERAAAHDHTLEFLIELRTSLKRLDRWARWLDLTAPNTTAR